MHIKKHPRESFALAVLDNGAWVLYSLSMTLIPISLSTTISGAYIILTILLGVTINKEKLLGHQWAGVIVAVISVLTLSIIS
jgi:drug/metabolite transporter (DMT)-like permease